jgi:hypothetical protein
MMSTSSSCRSSLAHFRVFVFFVRSDALQVFQLRAELEKSRADTLQVRLEMQEALQRSTQLLHSSFLLFCSFFAISCARAR